MWYHALRSILFPVSQTATFLPSEQRSGVEGYPVGDFWRGWGDLGGQSTAGVTVSRQTALGVPAIWAAIDAISKTLASLPFSLFEATEQGSKPATRHPAYPLVKIKPSPFHTSYTFRAALFTQACFGDAFAKIHRNGIGRAVQLELIDAENVTVYQRDSGEYFYIVRRQVGNRYIEEAIRYENMLHLKGLTLDGICGEDVIKTHRDSIGTSIAAEQYGNFFFANGASPSGALVYPQALNKQQYDEAKRKFSDQYGGVKKAGKTVVLDGGLKYEKFSFNPQEAAMNETRNFQVNQAARIFGVPVHLLAQMDKSTFNNMENMSVQFVTLCLRPYAVQCEQEFAAKLLTSDELFSERYFFRFNFSGLLRGNTQERAAYYKQALGGLSTGIGWMSVNEVRELENLDKVEDGDEVFTAEKMQAAQQQTTNDEETTPPDETTNDEENATPQASRAAAN